MGWTDGNRERKSQPSTPSCGATRRRQTTKRDCPPPPSIRETRLALPHIITYIVQERARQGESYSCRIILFWHDASTRDPVLAVFAVEADETATQYTEGSHAKHWLSLQQAQDKNISNVSHPAACPVYGICLHSLHCACKTSTPVEAEEYILRCITCSLSSRPTWPASASLSLPSPLSFCPLLYCSAQAFGVIAKGSSSRYDGGIISKFSPNHSYSCPSRKSNLLEVPLVKVKISRDSPCDL